MTILDDDLVLSSENITVGTSATALDTSSSPERVFQLIVQAGQDNTGNVFIGGPDVTTSNGIDIDALVELKLGSTEVHGSAAHKYNLGGFYAIADGANQSLRVLKIKRQRDL